MKPRTSLFCRQACPKHSRSLCYGHVGHDGEHYSLCDCRWRTIGEKGYAMTIVEDCGCAVDTANEDYTRRCVTHETEHRARAARQERIRQERQAKKEREAKAVADRFTPKYEVCPNCAKAECPEGCAGSAAARRKPPEHYSGAIEPWDYIAAHGLSFWQGNVIKYVTRAGRKEGAEAIVDYKKAQSYIRYLIEQEEKAND